MADPNENKPAMNKVEREFLGEETLTELRSLDKKLINAISTLSDNQQTLITQLKVRNTKERTVVIGVIVLWTIFGWSLIDSMREIKDTIQQQMVIINELDNQEKDISRIEKKIDVHILNDR